MNLMDRALVLRATSAFRSLDLDMLLAVADRVTVADYDAGDVIFYEGQEAQRIFIVVSGAVRIQSTEMAPSYELMSPDLFGDEAIFNGGIRRYTARADRATTLCLMSRTTLLSVIAECPSVAVSLLRDYSTAVPYRERHSQHEVVQSSEPGSKQ